MERLYTYGYGSKGATVEDLLRLIRAGAVVIDCRYAPVSARVEWSKEHLEAKLGEEYRWVHTLGNVNYRAGGEIQIKDLPGGLRVLGTYLEQLPVVLLCACASAARCHRSVVARAAEERFGCEVIHLKPGQALGPQMDPERFERTKSRLCELYCTTGDDRFENLLWIAGQDCSPEQKREIARALGSGFQMVWGWSADE